MAKALTIFKRFHSGFASEANEATDRTSAEFARDQPRDRAQTLMGCLGLEPRTYRLKADDSRH